MNGKRGRRLQRERECQGEYRGYDCIPFSELFRSGCHLISSPLGEGVLAPLHLEEVSLPPLNVELPSRPPVRSELGGAEPAGVNRWNSPPLSGCLPTAPRLVHPQNRDFGR